MADGSQHDPGLTAFLQAMANEAGISQEFMDASDHPYTCTCAKCAQWWREMGPDPDTGEYGPFGKELSPA